MQSEKVLVCACADTGSIGFHNDEKDTVILVGEKVYDLVLSTRTLTDLIEMPSEQRPHVRHLNRIPIRSAAEQKTRNESSLSKTFDEAQKISSEKAAQQYAVKKAKIEKTKPTGGEKMAKPSKIKEVIEALHHKALTKADMVAMGVSESTVQTQLYKLKRDGFTIVESQVAGKTAYKITKAPAAAAKPALAASAA